MEKNVLITNAGRKKKKFTKWVKYVFATTNSNWNKVETHQLYVKEKVPGTAVSKEDHADSLIGHERTHHLISLKRCNCKQCFLLPIP